MGLGLCSLAADPELNLGLGIIRSLLEADLKMQNDYLLFVEMENATNKERQGGETAQFH